MKQKYLDIVINHLKDDKKYDVFELYELLKTNSDIVGLKEEILSDLYRDLIFDNRFFMYPNKKWGLREDMSAELILKENKTYTIEDFSNNIDVTKAFNDNSLTEEDAIMISKRSSKRKSNNITLRIQDNLSKMNNSNKKNIAQELGVTEEIDWVSLEKQLSENN